MTALDMARQALHGLTGRIRARGVSEDGDSPGYTALIEALDDLGRSLANPEPTTLRLFLATMAAGREALEQSYLPEDVFKTPWAVLSKEKEGASYAAGALWAASALVDGLLRERDYQDEARAGRSQRETCRATVMELLGSQVRVRPGDVIALLQARGLEVDPAVVSRAIADLIESGEVEPAPHPENEPRHFRFYQAAQA